MLDIIAWQRDGVPQEGNGALSGDYHDSDEAIQADGYAYCPGQAPDVADDHDATCDQNDRGQTNPNIAETEEPMDISASDNDVSGNSDGELLDELGDNLAGADQ